MYLFFPGSGQAFSQQPQQRFTFTCTPSTTISLKQSECNFSHYVGVHIFVIWNTEIFNLVLCIQSQIRVFDSSFQKCNSGC